MKVFLDDQCGIGDVRESWVPNDFERALNFAEFKELIEKAEETGEKIEVISFDNDLGVGSGELEEGVEILKWLSKNYPHIFKPDIELRVHSKNDVARKNMEAKIRLWQTHVEDLIEAKNRPNPFGEMEKNI